MLSLDYFSSITMAPMFAVGVLYDASSHPANYLLKQDLENISQDEIEWYEQNDELGIFLRDEDTLLRKRILLFSERVSEAISKLRKEKLCSNQERPAPYDRPSLQDLLVDDKGMVKCTDISIIRNGFQRNGEAFIMLPNTSATNSSYWLFNQLGAIGRRDLIKIRLDPLIHEPVESFNPMEFRMQVYGTKLDWNRIKSLTKIEQTEFIPDIHGGRDVYKTEVVWRPTDDEIHFTCEELPKFELLNMRGSRYFHAIFQKDTGILKHCDGAIRFYTEEEYNKRVESHIKSNVVTRIGTRIKVFQIDVPKDEVTSEPVTHRHFINLVTSFFVWNHDILEYFNRSK